MPRPPTNRIVHEPPLFNTFKPTGVRAGDIEHVMLSLDEFEAVRLADSIGLSHEEAAEEMEISRSTFTRLIEKARKIIADFIIEGKMLTIDGGNVHFRTNIIRCQKCGHMFKTNFNELISECPACHSENLLNLAGGFGHGKCCNLQQHKKGGENARI
jgi:predicted DNA-binding protein (UPF0251 family)